MVPASEIRQRLTAARAAMRRARLGAMLVTSREDVHYLSGFTGSDSALYLTATRQTLLTDFRYVEEAEHSAPLFETIQYKKSLAEHAGTLARKHRASTLGIDDQQMAVSVHRQLKKAAKGVRLAPFGSLLADLRARKSPWEVRKVRNALRCAEAAFETCKTRVRPGMRECDFALDLEWEMRRRGATGPAFETIIAAGANASRPHAHAEKRKFRDGGLVLIDFGACVDRYNSDLTRVLFLGSIPKFWKCRYNKVLEAQAAGIAQIRPAVAAQEADLAARRVFSERKWESHFGHSLGHGVGLAVHESPRLSRANTRKLEPGMIVTVEPGLYFPRRGGIRIEDMVLVTEEGHSILSSLGKSPEWAVV